MDLNETADHISYLYQILNIEHCIVVYIDDNEQTAHRLSDLLIEQEYPVFFMTPYHHIITADVLSKIEKNYRLLVVPTSMLTRIIEIKNSDISNISLILGLDIKTTEIVREVLLKHNPVRQTSLQLITA